MGKTVLVLGSSGLFGSHAARAFGSAGWEVRRFKRGTDMIAAAEGADVIVNSLNPPLYHDWKTIVPRITAEVIAAGKASGATVIVPGNVYVYGREPGPWRPDTPQRPVSRKGAIRVTMEAEYRRAAEEGMQTIILRGGDFLAPEAPNSFMNMIVLKKLARGRMTVASPMEVRRAWAYLPDMTRAAVALAGMRAELPAFSDIPFAGFTLSMADVKTWLEAIMGQELKLSRFPWWAMRLAAPFWELARELQEMRYLYELPHALDPAPLARLLPEFRLTGLDTMLREHVERLVPQGSEIVTQTGK